MNEHEMMERDQFAARIEEEIWRWTKEYCEEREFPYMWRRPVVRFGDANSPLFAQLSEVVVEGHHVPQDYMEDATVVVSYFLPFTKEVDRGNVEGRFISKDWADNYNFNKGMSAPMNHHLAEWLNEQGYAAVVPTDANVISEEVLFSRWSQKHVAYICGHGTFGINNMLISDKGGSGRYYSIVAKLPVMPHQPVTEERCIYKKNGKCLLCVKRCVGEALTLEAEETGAAQIAFDRKRCLEQCYANTPVTGASACGKCVVGLPCSYKE